MSQSTLRSRGPERLTYRARPTIIRPMEFVVLPRGRSGKSRMDLWGRVNSNPLQLHSVLLAVPELGFLMVLYLHWHEPFD